MKYAKTLQNCFTYLASRSSFPTIGLLDFSAFCHDSKVIDSKFISSTVDRQFIAATSPNPALDSDKGV